MTFDKTYEDVIKHEDYSSRLEEIRLLDNNATSPREISNKFYKSPAWLEVRDAVIRRDRGCDLGVLGMYIDGPILVHHINPLTRDDIENWNEEKLFDMNNLICTSRQTHNKIHYGETQTGYVERTPGDTDLF